MVPADNNKMVEFTVLWCSEPHFYQYDYGFLFLHVQYSSLVLLFSFLLYFEYFLFKFFSSSFCDGCFSITYHKRVPFILACTVVKIITKRLSYHYGTNCIK